MSGFAVKSRMFMGLMSEGVPLNPIRLEHGIPLILLSFLGEGKASIESDDSVNALQPKHGPADSVIPKDPFKVIQIFNNLVPECLPFDFWSRSLEKSYKKLVF